MECKTLQNYGKWSVQTSVQYNIKTMGNRAKTRALHNIKTMENRVQNLEHNTTSKLWKPECKK